MKTINWTSTSSDNVKTIKIDVDEDCLGKSEKFMSDKLMEKCTILENKLNCISKKILYKTNQSQSSSQNIDNELNHVDEPSQYTVNCIGRICCDSDGHINTGSVVLIGNDDLKLRTVPLNLTKMQKYAIYPGQIVSVKGMNPRGDELYAEEIQTDYDLTLNNKNEINEENRHTIVEPISIVIAAGPYTLNDDLTYEPLQSLLAYCKTNKPDIVLLVGPFLDENNTLIVDGVIAESFDGYFEKMVAGIVEAVG